MEPRLNDV